MVTAVQRHMSMFTSSDISSGTYLSEKNASAFEDGTKTHGVSLDTEIALARKIADHPAAKQTMQALLSTAMELVTSVHGELDGSLKIIHAACDSQSTVKEDASGVAYPTFRTVGSVGWNGPNILQVKHSNDIRAQSALFDSLINSKMFSDTLNAVTKDENLQKKCADLIDMAFLMERCQHNADTPYHYSDEFRQSQAQSRQRPSGTQVPPGESAEWLVANRGMSANQLKFQLLNPVNGPRPLTWLEPAANVYAFAAINGIDLSCIQVHSDYGDQAWETVKTSDFNLQAHAAGLPVAASPSGTTNRVMLAGRLLAPGVQSSLGLPPPQEAGIRPADHLPFLELMRFTLYGLLVQDHHHSFVEVNRGAAEHGLPMQWTHEIHVQPFSSVIEGKGFEVSNEAMERFALELESCRV